MRKGIVVAVVLLFFGIAAAPGIIANGQHEQKYVKFVTDVCGVEKIQPHSVQLTVQQASEIDSLFQTLKNNLNHIKTQDEAKQLLRDALSKLNTYGVLPKEMSVDQALDLVMSRYYDDRNLKSIGVPIPTTTNSLEENNTNLLSIIVGHTTHTSFQTPRNTAGIISTSFFSIPAIIIMFFYMGYLFFGTHNRPLLELVGALAFTFLQSYAKIIAFSAVRSGISAYANIWFTSFNSKGWLQSIGLTGKHFVNVTTDANLVGNLRIGSLGRFFNAFTGAGNSIGVKGFTGLHFNLDTGSAESYYLGSALMVSVSVRHL